MGGMCLALFHQARGLALAVVASLAAALPASAEWRSFAFRWVGGGGYVMQGGLGWEADGTGALIREEALGCFFIEGQRGGVPVGRWGLGMLDEATTWVLHFDPTAAAFLVYGDGHPMPQAWNMNGFGTDCGAGGFGFNIGNAAQDLCHDGALLVESQVDPRRPFPAVEQEVEFPPWACEGPALMSEAEGAEHVVELSR